MSIGTCCVNISLILTSYPSSGRNIKFNKKKIICQSPVEISCIIVKKSSIFRNKQKLTSMWIYYPNEYSNVLFNFPLSDGKQWNCFFFKYGKPRMRSSQLEVTPHSLLPSEKMGQREKVEKDQVSFSKHLFPVRHCFDNFMYFNSLFITPPSVVNTFICQISQMIKLRYEGEFAYFVCGGARA